MGHDQLISFLAEKLDCRLVEIATSDSRYWIQMLNKSIGEIQIDWTQQAGWHVKAVEYYYHAEVLNRNVREFNANASPDLVLEKPGRSDYEEAADHAALTFENSLDSLPNWDFPEPDDETDF
jgi:hypothetical protein